MARNVTPMAEFLYRGHLYACPDFTGHALEGRAQYKYKTGKIGKLKYRLNF